LMGALDARLSFFAKWNTESQYDFVQVLASGDLGNNWVPLCGKYTKEGSQSERPGEPVYDGIQNEWVSEEMSLDEFLDQQILIKFVITSDDFQQRDGFYFDDLKVSTIEQDLGIKNEKPESYLSRPMPNPASDDLTFIYSNVFLSADFVVTNTL